MNTLTDKPQVSASNDSDSVLCHWLFAVNVTLVFRNNIEDCCDTVAAPDIL